jgi:nitrogen-specific signal transduction histidine kinase
MRRNLLLLSVISHFTSAPTTPHLPGWGVEVKSNDYDAINDKIMQPFFTTKPTGEGTGLGLSLTYDMVVKSHRGNIAVDTVEGEFTEFTIILPIT